MKKIIISVLPVILFAFSFAASAQNIPSGSITINDEYLVAENNAEHPCITEQEYEIIEKRCAENVKQFGLNRTEKSLTSVALAWPLRPSVNLHDCSYYHIAAYVDQNTTTGVFQDYNCGTNTYDGHRGTDIAT